MPPYLVKKKQLVPTTCSRTIGYIFILLLSLSASAQSIDSAKAFANEISLTTDNDILFVTDKYYTAGEDLSYRFQPRKPEPIFQTGDSSRTILSFHYGFKVFNPRNLDADLTQFMDRPYCGWHYLAASVLNFRKKNSGNFFMMQLGVVGPMSGMGQFQQWWHKVLNQYAVRGWDTQINNEVVVNFNYSHTHGFSLAKKIEIVSTSGAWIGTGSNRIAQEITLRLFRFNSLAQSAFMNANISRHQPTKPECFVFVSVEGDYVFSNIFIEGSLFRNNPSQFVTTINPWLFTRKIGIQYSRSRVTLALAFVHLSNETEFVGAHDYTNLVIARRF